MTRHPRLPAYSASDSCRRASGDIDAVGHLSQHLTDGGTIGGGHQLNASPRQAACQSLSRHAWIAARADSDPPRRITALLDASRSAGVRGHVGAALVMMPITESAHSLDLQPVRPRPVRQTPADQIRNRLMSSRPRAIASMAIVEQQAIERARSAASVASRMSVVGAIS